MSKILLVPRRLSLRRGDIFHCAFFSEPELVLESLTKKLIGFPLIFMASQIYMLVLRIEKRLPGTLQHAQQSN